MSSEFKLIERYFTHCPTHTALGVGDDAALIVVPKNCELAISADMLVSGTHFLPEAKPLWVGHKALAVNLSDMAAMGAAPRWATLALALPNGDARWVSGFMRGFMALARQYRVDLIGGDTTRGPLNICVQIIGLVSRGRALRRDGARPADDIWVSGFLGDAALALAARRGEVRLAANDVRRCAVRLNRPVPRVELGRALLGLAHSAIDISDGLLGDLGHILKRSGVACEIEYATLPASATLRRHLHRVAGLRALLAGGDDYELCFTAPRSARRRLAALSRRLQVALTRIGHIRRREPGVPDLVVRAPDGTKLRAAGGGYDHFG